ncbi:MAG: acetolactate synthase small subunit, partial [Clostridiales bacterium]|nr:acetolactate synthase small subunit [Clostridiales bacterium]
MDKKRWVSLFVENNNGILAKISELFAGKMYNIDSITSGTTDDPTTTRITIQLTSDDITFEQIKKQLSRCVGVIKVIDFTDIPTFKKELIFIKVTECSQSDKDEIFKIASVFNSRVIDYGVDSILTEGVNGVEIA